MKGLKLALDGFDHSIYLEGIGFGNQVDDVLSKIDKLHYQEDVDIIIGYLGDYKLERIFEKLNSLEIKSVIARLGAYPDLKYPNNQFVHSISYNLCESVQDAVKWGIKNGDKKVAVSGSFYEAGYGFMSALQETLYSEGGEFAEHYFPPHEVRENEKEIAKEFYESSQADVVFQFFNGVYAEENIDSLEAAGKIENKLVFIPPALNDKILERLSRISSDVKVVATWLPASLTGEESKFDQLYASSYNETPDASSMLGYEAGLGALELNNHGVDSLIVPREKPTWNDDLRFVPQNYVWKLSNETDKPRLVRMESLSHDQVQVKDFNGQEAGWYNAYLCY